MVPADVIIFNHVEQNKTELFAVVIYENDTQIDWFCITHRKLVSS